MSPDPSPAPQALILAAGVGRRLAGAYPKSLLEFGGRTLLHRHLDLLAVCGVADVTVVVGHQAERVRAALGARAATVPNPDYAEGSVVSLWAGRAVLRAGRPVVLMDADVLYDARLLRRLLGSAHPTALLVDRDIEPGDEPVKLCVAGGRIVDFRKKPDHPGEWHGESVGFFRLSPDAAAELADRADAYVTGGRRHLEYEEPLRDMMLSGPASLPGAFGFEDVTGLPWTEIDFAEDVAKAQALLPLLEG